MLRIRAEKTPWSDRIQLLIGEQLPNGRHAIAKPVVLEEVDDGTISEPSLTLSNQAAQDLMDELWRTGLRPTEGTGSAGSLAATQEHLRDMRKIAFSLLPDGKIEHRGSE